MILLTTSTHCNMPHSLVFFPLHWCWTKDYDGAFLCQHLHWGIFCFRLHFIKFNCDIFFFCGFSSSMIHLWLAALFVKSILPAILHKKVSSLCFSLQLCAHSVENICASWYSLVKSLTYKVGQKLPLNLESPPNPDGTAARQKNRTEQVQNKINNACRLSLWVTFKRRVRRQRRWTTDRKLVLSEGRIRREGRRLSTCSSDWCVLAPSPVTGHDPLLFSCQTRTYPDTTQ